MLESLAVGSIVLFACMHVAWQLAPTLWRQPFAARLARRIEDQLEDQQRRAAAAQPAQGAGPTQPGDQNPGLYWRQLLLRLLRAPSAGCSDCGGRSRCPAQTTNQKREDIDHSRLIIVSRR